MMKRNAAFSESLVELQAWGNLSHEERLRAFVEPLLSQIESLFAQEPEDTHMRLRISVAGMTVEHLELLTALDEKKPG